MSEFLAPAQLWLQAGHLILVIFWLAALYYLPRIFVYHAEAQEAGQKEILTRMGARLLAIIANPAACLALISGLMLFFAAGGTELLRTGHWFAVKLALVCFLLLFHGACIYWQRGLAAGRSPSARFFRLVNEIPPVLTIFIVLLAVAKPF